MTQREWEIPAATIPGQRIEQDAEGKQRAVAVLIGLAELIVNDVLSQPELFKTIEGIDLVMTLNPLLRPLYGNDGAGKKVRQSESQWELLKTHVARLFQRVAPEMQMPIAEMVRSILTAKVVTDPPTAAPAAPAA